MGKGVCTYKELKLARETRHIFSEDLKHAVNSNTNAYIKEVSHHISFLPTYIINVSTLPQLFLIFSQLQASS